MLDMDRLAGVHLPEHVLGITARVPLAIVEVAAFSDDALTVSLNLHARVRVGEVELDGRRCGAVCRLVGGKSVLVEDDVRELPWAVFAERSGGEVCSNHGRDGRSH